MRVQVEVVDIEKTKAHWPKEMPFEPALVRARKKDKGHWVVLSSPMEPGAAPQWAYSEHDEYLRIPLFPYLLSAQADHSLAFMLQLGLSCAGHLPGKVLEFFVVTGKPVELLFDPDTQETQGMRYWVGFAVIVEEP
jgi:hypothetical protein